MPEFQTDEISNSEKDPVPHSWYEAIPALIASRLGIFRIEAQEALAALIGKLVLIGLAVFLFVCGWLLLLAGLLGWVSTQYGWPWYLVALAAAGAHFLLALVVFLIFRSAKKTCAFPVTCQEFEKDRQWLNQLKNPPKSQN